MKSAYVSDSLGAPIHARGIFHFSKNFLKLLHDQGHQIDLVINRPFGLKKKLKGSIYSAHGFKNVIETAMLNDYLLNHTSSSVLTFKYLIKKFSKWMRGLSNGIPCYFKKPQIVLNKTKDLAYRSPTHDFLKFYSNFLLVSNVYDYASYSPMKKIDLRGYDLTIKCLRCFVILYFHSVLL